MAESSKCALDDMIVATKQMMKMKIKKKKGGGRGGEEWLDL